MTKATQTKTIELTLKDEAGGAPSLDYLSQQVHRCVALYGVFQPAAAEQSRSTEPLERIAAELEDMAATVTRLTCDVAATTLAEVCIKLDIAVTLMETRDLHLAPDYHARIIRSAREDLQGLSSGQTQEALTV
ncbi:MAG: hypothetical protein AAF337_06405 [Pseudomonadota bacterium]